MENTGSVASLASVVPAVAAARVHRRVLYDIALRVHDPTAFVGFEDDSLLARSPNRPEPLMITDHL
jgi:hypothetical protein